MFETNLIEVGKSYFTIMCAYQKQLVYIQHYLKLGNYTVRNFATRLRELNNYLPYFPREKGQTEPCKLSDDKLVFILNQAKPENWQTGILGANIELYQFDFKVPLIILRNLKSDRRSRQNAVKTNALIILVQIRIRAKGIRTNPKRPNNSPNTRNVRIVVVQTVRQKTVGLALRTKESPSPVKSLRTKRS